MFKQLKRSLAILMAVLMAASTSFVTSFAAATFESDGGQYTLAYILNHYNVFVANDFSGTHVVGPVVTGGSFKQYLGGLTGVIGYDGNYRHTAPSYIGGSVPSGWFEANIYSDSFPIYLGTVNEGNNSIGVKGTTALRDNAEAIVYTDNYVNFGAMDSLANQARALKSSAGTYVKVDGNSSDYYEINGDTIKLNAVPGIVYDFTGMNLGGKTLDFQCEDTQNVTVYSDDASFNMPSTLFNGTFNPNVNVENNPAGTNIVFALPNATTVESSVGYTGHLVAPKANANINGGYFDGCIIANNVVTSNEGHMHPAKLNQPTPEPTPAKVSFEFAKQLKNITSGAVTAPQTGDVFKFVLEEASPAQAGTATPTDAGVAWEKVEEAQNNGAQIKFGEIVYNAPGTHWYRVTEIDSGAYSASEVFFIKVEVKLSGNAFTAEVTYKEGTKANGLTCVDGVLAFAPELKDCSQTPATFVNQYSSVYIRKTDANGKDLSGAKLTLYDGNGKAVASWTTNGTKFTVDKIKDGIYVLAETAAPAGYDIAPNVVFEVKDGKVVGKSDNTVVMIDKLTEKKDSSNSNTKPNNSGSKTPTNGSKGRNVKTSDSTNTILWISILLAGVAGMIALTIVYNRKRITAKFAK